MLARYVLFPRSQPLCVGTVCSRCRDAEAPSINFEESSAHEAMEAANDCASREKMVKRVQYRYRSCFWLEA